MNVLYQIVPLSHENLTIMDHYYHYIFYIHKIYYSHIICNIQFQKQKHFQNQMELFCKYRKLKIHINLINIYYYDNQIYLVFF